MDGCAFARLTCHWIFAHHVYALVVRYGRPTRPSSPSGPFHAQDKAEPTVATPSAALPAANPPASGTSRSPPPRRRHGRKRGRGRTATDAHSPSPAAATSVATSTTVPSPSSQSDAVLTPSLSSDRSPANDREISLLSEDGSGGRQQDGGGRTRRRRVGRRDPLEALERAPEGRAGCFRSLTLLCTGEPMYIPLTQVWVSKARKKNQRVV